MPNAAKSTASLPADLEAQIHSRWKSALSYYQKRRAVIFMSYCRFWESHPFPQQSLARALVAGGVKVIWLDSFNWRSYTPVVEDKTPLLDVRPMFKFPGDRLSWVQSANCLLHALRIKKLVRRHGNPVIWVQAGIEESLAKALPYIDVFSVFDDPYRHDPAGALCTRARTIVTQNSFAHELMARHHPGKSHASLPPIEVRPETFDSAEEISLPPSFPKKVMGYVGSFGSPRFDLAMFENFVRSLPDWGFLIAGRTDDEGERWTQAMKRYPNFLRLPPVPRRKLAPVWNLLDVTLLLYKDLREQHGAFPSKVLESAFFGVPCVATQCVMTRDLEGIFARGHDADHLKNLALEASKMSVVEVRHKYFDLATRMSPELHLADVEAWLTHS